MGTSVSDPRHRIQRILNVIAYVQSHPGVSVEELAHYFASSPREIVEDLDRALLCGVPPYLPDDYIGVYIEGGRAEIRFADHFRRPFRFTPNEALALLLALRSLPEGGDEEEGRARRSLEEKITRALQHSFLAPDERALATRIEEGLPSLPKRHTETLSVLRRGLEERKTVEIEHLSQRVDALERRSVRPYGIVEKAGQLYLVGWCELRQAVRTFRVDKIRTAQLTGASFAPPAKFDLERFEKTEMDFQRRFTVTAKVRVRGERVVRWLEEVRPQDVLTKGPGEAVVQLKGFDAASVVQGALAFGHEVEVLEPPEVREALIRYLDDALTATATAPEPPLGPTCAAPPSGGPSGAEER